MRIRIESFDIGSVAKVCAFIGVFIGWVVGSIYGLILGLMNEPLLGLTLFLIMPLIYFLIFGISGAFYALIYNLASKSIGGIKLNYKEKI